MINRLTTRDPDFARSLAALIADRATATDVTAPVAAIIARVRAEGDAALLDLTARFDRFPITLDQLAVTPPKPPRPSPPSPPLSATRSIWPPAVSRRSTAPNCRAIFPTRTIRASPSACAGARSMPSASTSPAARRPTRPRC
jgi:Histidinol dehydrogenase